MTRQAKLASIGARNVESPSTGMRMSDALVTGDSSASLTLALMCRLSPPVA